MNTFSFKKKGKANSISEPIRRAVKEVSLPPAFLMHTKVHGSSPTYLLPMDREFFIGKNKEMELCLEGEDIDDIHAKVRPEQDGYVLYILTSKSEIHVNWDKVLKRKLEHKDRIKIGSHVLIFQFVKEEEKFFDGIEIRKNFAQRPAMTLKFLVNSDRKLEEYSGIVRDITLDGARIATEKELSKGTVIEAGISSSELALVEVLAQVIWERVNDKGDKILYDVGLQFLEMDEKSRKSLKDYLSK